MYGFNVEKLMCKIDLVQLTKHLQREKPFHQGKISFKYEKNKLRPYRYELLTKNTYRYLKAKDIIEILKKVSRVVFTQFDKPKNLDEYLEFFNYLQIEKPKILPICYSCMKEEHLITKLTPDKTFDMYGHSVCRACALFEIRDEYNKRGIPITKSAQKFFTKQLDRYKSVEQVCNNIWDSKTVSKDANSSLYDVIPADKNAIPVDFKRFLKENKLESYFDKKLVDHWYSVGFNKLLPVQRLAIKNGLMENRDLLVVAGTSSGKTFIAELVGLQKWKSKNSKLIFVTPLIALSNQKYSSFRKRYSKIGARIALRVGKTKITVEREKQTYPEGNFSKSDIIVATYEALDWIIRSGNWKNIGKVGTVVIDEFQLLADEERGAELDGLLSRIRAVFPHSQIIALSATIGNAEELSHELNFKLISYMKRPIPLEMHIIIAENNEKKIEAVGELVKTEAHVKSSSGHKGQTLVFTNSRRRVQDVAAILRSMGLKSAYYHAGMTYFKRKKIEEEFESGKFEVLTTTAALGAGADFPVSQVIFERPAMGARWLKVSEFHQMIGRAGRYGYHDLGKAVLVAIPGEKIYKSQDYSEEQVAFDLMTGEVEDIDGEITVEQEQEQVLAYISAATPINDEQLKQYYTRLFYNTNNLKAILKVLADKGLILKQNSLWYVTALGRAISESFLQPLFGYNIAKKARTHDILDIAIEITPFTNVYLSTRIQARLEQAVKSTISTRFFSDAVLDIISTSKFIRGSVSPYLIDRIKDWNRVFFDCNCKENPYCIHPINKLSKLIINLRIDGLTPEEISSHLRIQYDLKAYTGDLLNWLDEIIHAVQSISRLANAMGDKNLYQKSREISLIIEEPSTSYSLKSQKNIRPTAISKQKDKHSNKKQKTDNQNNKTEDKSTHKKPNFLKRKKKKHVRNKEKSNRDKYMKKK